MPKKSSQKNKSKQNPTLETNRGNEFFQQLLDMDNPIFNSPSGSSSNSNQGMGFASYSSSTPAFTPQQMNMYQQQYMNLPFQPHFQQQSPFRQPMFQQTPTRIPQQISSEEDEAEEEEVEEIQPEEIEEVEETQPDPRGKAKKVRCKKIPWSDVENLILANVWMQVSECVKNSNNQSKDSFWGSIREKYNSQVTEKRRADQITGKWSKMSRDVKIFIGCHTKIASYWQSGANDADIMSHARKAFKDQTGRPFSYEEPWRVLKDCPKFLTFVGVVNKRKAPIDEPIYVGDDNPNQTMGSNPVDFESQFREEPLRRPPGRASAKSQRSSGSSDAASRLSAEEAHKELIETSQATRRTMDKIYDATEHRTMLESLKFLTLPVAPDLTPEQHELVLKARISIEQRYANAFNPPPPPPNA